jgi:hemoglobin-like flavoprotein
MNDAAEVEESFERCLLKGDVIGRFYDIFMDSHPDIKPRFANTNFDSQKKLLRQSVGLAILYARNNPVGRIGINRLARSHSKSGLDIPPPLYVYWKSSFLQALSEFDEGFSDELRTSWDSVLQGTIDAVAAGYEG